MKKLKKIINIIEQSKIQSETYWVMPYVYLNFLLRASKDMTADSRAASTFERQQFILSITTSSNKSVNRSLWSSRRYRRDLLFILSSR